MYQNCNLLRALAHTRQDHGKTSLTDALIATNGIISPKLAGKIRYLDSRPDEQLRGITMESSAISLYFSLLRRSAPDAQPEQREFLINLIDSPGHIDFSYEVSTASRLCDGAVVLVDAVEGVCSQTVTVLRQTWIEKLKPLLVINKMDRLITELKMSPGEAYTHLSKLIEQVNAVMGSFYQGERMEDDLRWREKMEERLNAAAEEKTDTRFSSIVENGDGIDTTSIPAEYEEKDDEDIYFAPENNNVIFGSAIDGWAFTVRQFASLYERKLGIKRAVLEKVLWGDFYLDPKSKRVLSSKHLKGRHLKPMFVQLVLENIWAVYEATTGGNNGKGCVDFLSFVIFVTCLPCIYRINILIFCLTEIRPWSRRLPNPLASISQRMFSDPETRVRYLWRSLQLGFRCRLHYWFQSLSIFLPHRRHRQRGCRRSLTARQALITSLQKSGRP
jgi:ribosome assembly protein 1